MTSKDVELIKEMLQMQTKLDEAIMKEYGLTMLNEENLRMAILDEVGELTHELKGNWCWWKKTQAPVDNDKVLGELVDIWHFELSFHNNFGVIEIENTHISEAMVQKILKDDDFHLTELLCDLVVWDSCKLERLIATTEYLGFTVEQVYQAYCDKNKVNYQRLKEGY